MKKVLSMFLMVAFLFSTFPVAPMYVIAQEVSGAEAGTTEEVEEIVVEETAEEEESDDSEVVEEEVSTEETEEAITEESTEEVEESEETTPAEEVSEDTITDADESEEETAEESEGVTEETPTEEESDNSEILEEIEVATTTEEVVEEDESNLLDQVIEDIVTPLLGGSSEEENSEITFVEKVELGVTYTYEGNSDVQVTFTKLPENPGSLSIEEVVLTDEQVKKFGALSNIAYDITSDMENGTFEYDLKLPSPKNSEKESKVIYAENVEKLDEGRASVVDSTKVSGIFEDSVEVNDMDHFTIFVVVRTSQEFAGLTWTADRSTPSGGWSETASTLVMNIVGSGQSAGSSFYYTEGVQADIPSGKNSVKAELFIDPLWSSVDYVRAGLWGKVENGSAVTSWPIMEFTNVDSDPRVRVWDTIVGGWTDVTTETVAYGDTVDFEVLQNPFTETFEFYLNGILVDSYSSVDGPDNYEFYDGLILNSYNNGVDDYEVTWSNLELGVVEAVPKTETTVVVRGDTAPGYNEVGWLFNRDVSTMTPFEFNTDASVIGDGSLYVLPVSGTNASDKFIGEYFLFEEIDSIDAISYDFQIGTGGTVSDENEFYMNVYANFGSSDPGKYYDCKYDVVPTTGTVGGFTTLTFDPTQSYPVAGAGCPSIPVDMNLTDPGSIVRMFALNLGDTSLSDAGLDGYFDNVIVDTDTKITTFDFDPTPNAAPVVVIEDPSPEEGESVKGIITGRATATDDEGMSGSYLRFWKDSFESGIGNLVQNCQNVPGGGLLGTSIDETCEFDTTTVEDGTYVFSVQVIDTDGVYGKELRTFIVDNTKPVVTLENPETTTVVVMGDTEFEISATDNLALNKIVGNIYKDGILVKSNSKTVTGTSASFTFDIASLSEGEYSMKYNASDKAGNIAQTKIFAFAVDDTPPTITIKEESVGNGIDTFSSVSFKLFDAYKIDKVEINGVLKDLTDNKWSDVNGVKPGTFGAVEGENTIVVYDVAGNETTFEFILDTVAPTAPSITKPTPRQWFKTQPIETEWTESADEGGIDEYQIAYAYDDGHTFGGSTCSEVSEIEGKPVSGCRNTSGTSRNHTPGLSEQGGVTVFVRAIDNAGNMSPWSESVHYYYDHEAPETDINVSPVVGGEFTVSGDATDNLVLNRVYVQLVNRDTNTRVGGQTIHLIGTGTSSPWMADYSGLPDGTYAAHASVTDMSGNTGTAGWTPDFTVINEEEVSEFPHGSITSPTEGELVSGTIDLTAEYFDGDDVNDDAVQWAVRKDSCSSNTVSGNVDGFSDSFDWDGNVFSSSLGTAPLEAGEYCFVFNPTDDDDERDVRETVVFTIEEVEEEEDDSTTTTAFASSSSDEDDSIPSGRRDGGGGSTGGSVLGASIGLENGCSIEGMYLNSYMGLNNVVNDPGDVALLQVFLNAHGYEVPVTGGYGDVTVDAVNKFQLMHLEEILTPWGITAPTGNVFKTTRWKINDIVCPGSEAFPLLP
ncbi:Ig-like domain-containing protein [Candidatus Pacebacteria bacterium]|nr:Ig-like domain-containing protein [Candidatus Paceibacterota bacterium]